MMSSITVVVRFAVLLWVLSVCCDVIECNNKHYRRHDVHRIVIKPKRKASYKKPSYTHSLPHDFHHYHTQDEMFDPYHAEPTHHMESMDDIPYIPSHHSFSSKYREPSRYKDRMRYPSYKPYPTSSLQHFEPEPYKAGYPDYKGYRDMMEEYNRKQEEEFRRQVEKAKIEMHFAQQQHQQQQHQHRPGPDMFQYSESQERPIWNAPQDTGMIKGDWSPMSHSESPYISPSYSKPSFESPSTTTQTSQYIDLTKLDMTTSKPHRLSPLMTAKNSTKNTNVNKQKVNYNFSPNYFPNHKPDNYKENENEVKVNIDDKTKEFQPSVVSTSYSTLWGNNDQNEAESNSNKSQSNSGGYGTKTKVRRTKRPAYGNH